MANETTRIVDAYYASWASGDFERLRTLLAEDFAFRGPMDSVDGPDAFIGLIQRNAPMFGEVAFRNVRRVADGARAVNLYDLAVGPIAQARSPPGVVGTRRGWH